nr:reverse transcriptase domain-containing protein [Tanacetum cinerariifolium]
MILWLGKEYEILSNVCIGCAIENQVKFATCTLLDAALTWWKSQIRYLGPDAYSMTWEVLKKKITNKYCPQGEIKKLEIELWNLKVKGNDVPAYTEHFQELTLICTKFVANETEKIDKYVSGIPDNIYESVKASKPKTLDETIDFFEVQRLTFHEVDIETKARSLHVPLVILVRTVAFVSVGEVSQKGLINHSLNGLWSHVVWVSVVRRDIRSLYCHMCHDSSKSQETKWTLASPPGCLALFGCSRSANNSACMSPISHLMSPSLKESLPSVLDAYAVSGVLGAETRVHTPSPGEFEAHNGLHGLIISSEPKLLVQHRPPPP